MNFYSSQILNGIEDEYDPLMPNSFESFHQALTADHQARVLRKRQEKQEQKSKKEKLETQNDKKDTFEVPKKENVAFKIMNKYGFKEGQGLGKSEQGMTQPLLVRKTGRTVGEIITEQSKPTKKDTKDELADEQQPHEQDKNQSTNQAGDYSNAALLKKPSQVILLRNMVEVKDVDEALGSEIQSECQKFGPIASLRIHPCSVRDSSGSEVRIFVEYTTVSSAIKAVIALNRRYFSGKMINCSFYDFNKYKLGEFDSNPLSQ